MKPAAPPPAQKSQTIDVVKRLSAPTTLAYELGAVAFATVAAPLILLGLRSMGH